MTDIDQRIEEIEALLAAAQYRGYVNVDGFCTLDERDIRYLISQIREHRTQRTLTECSKCGRGYRYRETAQVGDRRLCVECMADVVSRYRETLEKISDESRSGLYRQGLKVADGFGWAQHIARVALQGDSNE